MRPVDDLYAKRFGVYFTCEFTAELWLYRTAKAPWHFVTLDTRSAQQIRHLCPRRSGFGSVRVRAKVGDTVWKTSIFPDKRSESYLLPIKAQVRNQERLNAGDPVQVQLDVYPLD